jgi:hypothetical protein
MTQLGPFLVLIVVAAVLLAGLGGAVAWWNEEGRRIRRGLRTVLKDEPHAMLIAPGRGRGAGFNFTSNQMAVCWDSGGWCLLYRIDELLGVELVIDGHVAARSWRGETRRPLDVIGGAEQRVVLRLVFDDPQRPDFTLELWSAEDRTSRRGYTASDAVEEGNRWIARTESVFRRKPAAVPTRTPPPPEPLPPRPAAPETRAGEPGPAPDAPPASEAPRAPSAAPPRQELPFDAAPPWSEETDEDAGDEALL